MSNFSEIQKSWSVDPSLENQKIFHVLYGGFNENPGWQKQKEDGYMEIRGYVYKDVGWEGKGCIECMMTSQKNSLVGRVNGSSKNTHGLYISIVQKDAECALKLNGRMVKTMFNEDFVMCVLHL